MPIQIHHDRLPGSGPHGHEQFGGHGRREQRLAHRGERPDRLRRPSAQRGPELGLRQLELLQQPNPQHVGHRREPRLRYRQRLGPDHFGRGHHLVGPSRCLGLRYRTGSDRQIKELPGGLNPSSHRFGHHLGFWDQFQQRQNHLLAAGHRRTSFLPTPHPLFRFHQFQHFLPGHSGGMANGPNPGHPENRLGTDGHWDFADCGLFGNPKPITGRQCSDRWSGHPPG